MTRAQARIMREAFSEYGGSVAEWEAFRSGYEAGLRYGPKP